MPESTEKTGQKQHMRGRRGFAPGQSGNPNGRPPGARNKTTLAVEALLDGQAEALTQKAIDRALEGDSAALKICMDRIAPPRRDRPLAVDLPVLKEAADARAVLAAIIAATAEGELTPSEASVLAGLVADFATLDQTTKVDRGIRAQMRSNPMLARLRAGRTGDLVDET